MSYLMHSKKLDIVLTDKVEILCCCLFRDLNTGKLYDVKEDV